MTSREMRELEVRYEHGLQALSKLNDGSSRFLKLVAGILHACEDARRYSRDDDPNVRHRRNDAAFLEDKKTLVSAARRLSKSAREYRIQSAMTLFRALVKLRNKDLGVLALRGPGGVSVEEVFAQLLDAYAEALDAAPFAKEGDTLHRIMVGPLIFPEEVDSRSSRIDAAVTGLLFQLVLYIRRFIAGEPEPTHISQCEPMPDYGEPRYRIVCEFINDALGKATNEHSARQRLEKLIRTNPGIGFFAWPQNVENL